MQDGVRVMAANGKGSLGARIVAFLKRYWYHGALLILTTLISALVTAFRQFEFVTAFAFPLTVEAALLVYENAAKDVLRRDAKSRGVIEELFSLFYAISTSRKDWRNDAINSAKEAVNRCRRDLSNIKNGKLPIYPFEVLKNETMTKSSNELYAKQCALIQNTKEGYALCSIHRAIGTPALRLWDPKTYGEPYGEEESDESYGEGTNNKKAQSNNFYKYIIEPNKEARNRGKNGVIIRRLFIINEYTLLSDNAKECLGRTKKYQNKQKFECRFIEAPTVTNQTNDILMVGSIKDNNLTAPTAAILFESLDWSAEAYEIVSKKLLDGAAENFNNLWRSAKETLEELASDGQ